MATFVFIGRLMPDYLPLTLTYQPKIAVDDGMSVVDATFSLSIENGDIRVEATLEAFTDDTWEALFFFAQDLARTAAEVASIAEGVAYLPVLDVVIEPSGDERALVLADRRLAKLMTVFPDRTFEEVFDIVATDMALSRALSDAVVMLTWSHYTPIAAGRVIESILRMLTGGHSRGHWEQMQSTLRVDRAYLQLLTDHAIGPRHGDRQAVDGTTNGLLAERAWTVMNRYLAYRLGNGQPLDEVVFPLLCG